MMQDPFRPNSNAQLMREAQIGFIMVGLLLCVLVYVAFYRLTNRSSRFDEIARHVPVAQSVDSEPYPSQALVRIQEKLDQRFGARVRREKSATRFAGSDRFVPQTAPQRASAPRTNEVSVQDFTSVETDPNSSQKTNSTKRANAKIKVTPPVLTSEFNSLENEDFIADLDLTRPQQQVASAVFEVPSVATVAEVRAQPRSSNARNAQPLKPATDGEAGHHRLPQPQAFKANVSEGFLGDVTSARELDLGKNEQRQQGEPALVVQASGVEALNQTSVSERVSTASKQQQVVDGRKTYLTKNGESLWTIAQTVYGDGRYFRALHQQNLDVLSNADKIPTGVLLDVSTVEELQRRFPDLCPSYQRHHAPVFGNQSTDNVDQALEDQLDERFYRTEDGDTLFEIARQRLGQASRYLEIYDLNRFRIPETANHLTPLGGGIELLLPQ